MKKYLLLLLMQVAMLLPLSAQTFTVGQFTYEVNKKDTSKVTVTAIAATTSTPAKEDIIIPDNIEYEGTEYIVSKIDSKFDSFNSIFFSKNIELIQEDEPIIDKVKTEYSVDKSNPYYSSYDGCLYTKDGSRLIAVPSQKTTVNIKQSCKEIGDGAFEYFKGKQVGLPDGLEMIGMQAFHMSDLTEVTIPGSCKIIDEHAFSDCIKLKTITISEGVEEIYSDAFLYTPQLSTVVLPGSLKKLAIDAFLCYKGEEFTENYGVILIVQNPNLEFAYITQANPLVFHYPQYYAYGKAKEMLLSALGDKFVKDGPSIDTTSDGWEHVAFVGNKDNTYEFDKTFNLAFTNGFQFDMTVPADIVIDNIECSDLDESELTLSFSRLANGNYRVIAFSPMGETFDKNGEAEHKFTFTLKANEGFQRGHIGIKDIILSIADQEVILGDSESYQFITGYNLNLELPEIPEYDNIQLPNPMPEATEGVTYEWQTEKDGWEPNYERLVKISGNELTSYRAGNDVIFLKINDPEFAKISPSFSPYKNIALSVLAVLWGDADGNDSLNILDVVTILNHILGREQSTFNFKLADIDRNGRVNVVDITQIVRLILSVNEASGARYAKTRAAREVTEPDMEMTGEKLDNGDYQLNVRLSSEEAITALQTDLSIPEGMEVVSVKAGAGAKGHVVSYDKTSKGIRIVMYSMTLGTIKSGENILEIELSGKPGGDGTLTMYGTLMSDADRNSYEPGAVSFDLAGLTTGVEEIATDKSETIWYDLTGNKVSNPRNGLYIRVRNGKAEKVMR